MSQESKYTIIQRNSFGDAVNTITGLDFATAQTVDDLLRKGDAYQGDQPWGCDVVRELTPAEQLAARAETWLADNTTMLETTAQMATSLELLADRLRSLGDQPLGQMWLTVDAQITSRAGDEPTRRAAVDLLASVVGIAPEVKAHGSYSVHDKAPFRVFTPIEKPEPQALADDVPPVQDVEVPAVEHAHADDSAVPEVSPGLVVHRGDEFWKGDEPGSCGASCTCGTTYDGFDTLGEASDLVDRHIEVENSKAEIGSSSPQPIPAERVDELLRQLNQLTQNPDEHDGVDWWDWIQDVPEFDREATAASGNTAELHMTDGTVFTWTAHTSWTRAAVAR